MSLKQISHETLEKVAEFIVHYGLDLNLLKHDFYALYLLVDRIQRTHDIDIDPENDNTSDEFLANLIFFSDRYQQFINIISCISNLADDDEIFFT